MRQVKRMIVKGRNWRLLAIALVLVTGCQGLTEPATDGPLTVTARGRKLVIENTGSLPLQTRAIVVNDREVVDFIECTDAAVCPGLASGARKEVPYSQIYDYTRWAREAIIYGWHLVPNGDGFRVGKVWAVRVKL
jgi:hypothetical protein